MIQNRYLVVHLIGKGGMGEVYLAVDQRLGSAVALKRTFFQDNAALGTAFEREARILARLRHPVLPKVIDHFSENGDQFLVMEHIAGDDLSKRLENADKPFPLSWVMFWADQMLDALNYLHSHEPPIVHRDIKPQNLKLTDDNHIILLDFGLSKDFDTRSDKNSMNSASVAGYSPHFASMEQIRGTGTDARSDIFSLSATLYQLMTNTTPADVLTRADGMLGGGGDPVVPVSDINPEIPKLVSDVILKGIAVRQDERFASAVEMQKALRRAFNAASSEAQTVEFSAVDLGAQTANMPHTQMTAMLPTVPNAGEQAAEAEPAATEEFQPEPQAEPVVAEVPVAVEPEIEPEPESLPPPQTREMAAAAAASSAAPPTVEHRAFVPETPAPQPAPKKSSKAGLIIGTLAGLFLIMALAGVGGWYAYSNYSASAVPVATASPTPTPEVVMQPSPVASVAVESTPVEETTVAEEETAPEEDRSPNTTRDPSAPVTTTRPQTTTKNPPPPKPGQPAQPKGQPKPKPRDDRTVILQ